MIAAGQIAGKLSENIPAGIHRLGHQNQEQKLPGADVQRNRPDRQIAVEVDQCDQNQRKSGQDQHPDGSQHLPDRRFAVSAEKQYQPASDSRNRDRCGQHRRHHFRRLGFFKQNQHIEEHQHEKQHTAGHRRQSRITFHTEPADHFADFIHHCGKYQRHDQRIQIRSACRPVDDRRKQREQQRKTDGAVFKHFSEIPFLKKFYQ